MSRSPRIRARALKDWKCQECGKLLTSAGAEKAMSVGCTRCGGVGVDLVADARAEVSR